MLFITNCWKTFPEGPSSAPSTGGSAGGSRVVTPDSPFSVEDMSSDSIFYVQDGQRNTQASKDVFSFYISDGHSQTEAFSVEIDIQVGDVAVQPSLQNHRLRQLLKKVLSLWERHMFPCCSLCRVKKTGSLWCQSAASTWRKTPESSSPTRPSESSTMTLQRMRSSLQSSGSPPTVRTLAKNGREMLPRWHHGQK